MIKINDIYDLMEKLKTSHVKIMDMHGNLIMKFEDNKLANHTVKELQNYEQVLSSYGKIEIIAGTPEQCKANYRGAFKWICFFEKVTPGQQQISGPQWNTGNMWQTPPGFVNENVMTEKLAMLELRMKHEKEMRELTEKTKNPIDDYAKYFPLIMGALGKDDATVEKYFKWSMMANTKGGIGFSPTNTLTFEDVEKLTPDEKNERIQKALDSIAKKVHVKTMILLLQAIRNKPELAEKAIKFL